MGTTKDGRALEPALAARVKRETWQRVADAAKRMDQPLSAWLRMAIMEKLERDGG